MVFRWVIKRLIIGQSIVAASSMLILFGVRSYVSDSLPIIGIQSESSVDYLYSIFLLATFLGSSLALMKLNAYPSTVFVGDTFCYFAGIVLAIASMTSTNLLII
jgi:UDP-N-acetylglucosamine--dolichyl-phosphate N-acetylglucosaminephosphotransferase